MSELDSRIREIRIDASLTEIRLMLEMLQAIKSDTGPLAAAARASSVRMILEAAEELRKVTG